MEQLFNIHIWFRWCVCGLIRNDSSLLCISSSWSSNMRPNMIGKINSRILSKLFATRTKHARTIFHQSVGLLFARTKCKRRSQLKMYCIGILLLCTKFSDISIRDGIIQHIVCIFLWFVLRPLIYNDKVPNESSSECALSSRLFSLNNHSEYSNGLGQPSICLYFYLLFLFSRSYLHRYISFGEKEEKRKKKKQYYVTLNFR